ncbi:MAG: DUF5623 domain-containing protein [Betaproteobacteria bacterium]|nr:DUF5623 domain-containing protein [Betaproteobacteria bacterium]
MEHSQGGIHSSQLSVRSELDEWVQREYKGEELPSDQFFELYYHESGATITRRLPDEEKSRHLASIQK